MGQNDMKTRLRDHLPPAIRRPLGMIKVLLFGIPMRMLYPLFARRPIQANKIVFDNYLGRGYGCNPKYVAQKLLEHDTAGRYDIVWLVSSVYRTQNEMPPQIRTVKYGSFRALFEYATAKVWVSNYHKVDMINYGLRKREEQVFIQMWHGSLGIKKIDGDVSVLMQDKRWLRAAVVGSEMTDWWISNSDFETAVYKSAFWGVTDEKILLYGHPRNDIFFHREMMVRARQKVDELYGTNGKKLLLYAPTFRNEVVRGYNEIGHQTDVFDLSYPALLVHMQERFGGEWTVLVRLHPQIADMAEEIIHPMPNVIDASAYMDMQELLAAADCLITDYSSCAFDFMLTKRPVFLYAPDIHEYDIQRGFYYPLETTPFPLACDNAELMRNIDGFDNVAYRQDVEAFLKEKGCIEDGLASERVAALIERSVQQAKTACSCDRMRR